MPDFDTRKPEQNGEPRHPRIQYIASGLRNLLAASALGILSVANALRRWLAANRLRSVSIGGVLLLVIATSVGLLMHSPDRLVTQQQKVAVAKSKPLTGGCLYDKGNESRTFGDFRYSPDGQKIVFVSYYHYDSDSTDAPSSAPGTSREASDTEICVVDADGTHMVRLTDNAMDEYSASWSPDGKRIAFISYMYDTPSSITIMNADGSHRVELPGTQNANWGVLNALDWSPDGKNIAYGADDCNIYITSADGTGTPRNLTPDPAWQCSKSPAWSPDGKRIAFESERDTRRNSLGDFDDIYVMNASGEGDADQWRQITDDPGHHSYPDWSPDGTEIAFTRSQPTLQIPTVYTVDADGSKETRLVTGSSPNWLPNGKQFAYLGLGGLYKVDSDGSDQTLVIALKRPDY